MSEVSSSTSSSRFTSRFAPTSRVTESIRANSSTVLTLAGGVGVGTIGTGVAEFPRNGPAAADFSFAPPR